MIRTVIIQPPLVQLNTPYPSGAYLSAFFKDFFSQEHIEGTTHWLDLSTELFHKIFCKDGLSLIFEQSENEALKLAQKMENQGDENSAFQLRRYVSESQNWSNWIDTIVSIVCPQSNSGREYVHEFVRSAHAPRGLRMENHLANLGRDVTADDSQILASLALADLADYVTAVYDKNFSLIRYAESLAVSAATFKQAESAIDSPILKNFFLPLLQEKISTLYPEKAQKTNEINLFCITIPFPGCFVSALATASYIRKTIPNALISFGGGYVNTELRNIQEKKIFDYCHVISYDKGYGSYMNLFKENFKLNGKQLYKIKYLFNDSIIEPLHESKAFAAAENQFVRSIIPDFSQIDFTRSPRLADDNNPMHRIWNDGAWIKAFMAYGCYWHRCAFCDTSLDYVNNYCATPIQKLYQGLSEQAQKAGVFGIHFVDEACPPAGLTQFALLNAASKNRHLTFWGNVRFEKTFTRDAADLLSYGGLTAVSAGIEIATSNGLLNINKGTDMENIVSACCAFKEAGILVHSYMIFGFWNQTEQDLMDSMETLRQLFAAGLLDSAFWHKFSLTLHSTVYREWLEGKHKDLIPLPAAKNQFAENALNFKGEEKSQKYSGPLNAALEAWMHGQKLNKPCQTWFPFKMPAPKIKSDFIDSLIQKYEQKRDLAFSQKPLPQSKFMWIGGKIILLPSKTAPQLCWSYMGDILYADVSPQNAQAICSLLNQMSPQNSGAQEYQQICKILPAKLFLQLRGKGLCRI